MESLVAVHAIAATVVIVFGPVNLLRPRRDVAHRLIGRAWVVAMLITCVSSFGIRPHGFSWLHGLAVFTLVSVTLGVVNIRRRNVGGHRANMLGSYVGTLVAFGFATLAPNRLIARMAFDDPAGLVGVIALILACCAAFLTLALRPTLAPAPNGLVSRRG